VLALVATNWLTVEIPLLVASGIDALVAGDRATARGAAIWTGVLGALVLVIRTASRLLFFTPGRLVEVRAQHDLFERLLAQGPAFFQRHPAGDLSSRMTSDVQNLRLLFGFAALGMVNTVVAVALTGAQMARVSPTIAALAALPLLVAFGFTTSAASRLREITRQIQAELSALSDIALAAFQGSATVRAFDAEDAVADRLATHNDEIARAGVRRAGLRVWLGPLLVLAAAVDVFLALWLGGPQVIAGALSIGDVVAFTSLVGYLASPLRGFTFTLSVVRQGQGSVERLLEILDAEPERPDLPSPLPAPTAPPALALRGLTVRLGEVTALDGLTLDLPAGQVLGVFGPTGSGKTTLARCLLRLIDPPPGSLLVDGEDLRRVDLEGWRQVATLVPQRAFLFSETLGDNIGFGELQTEEILALCRRAQLAPDLAALPQGLDTVVGEAGLTLSGGQRQRVALARGLVRTSALLVLDDVLSAVDASTEQALVSELARRPDRPTTVIISNRLSALEGADRILVLDHGRGVDQGTHAELIARPGAYREAWLAQGGGAP
jgi:ATP-binding cassette subfamily B protein